MKTKYLAAEMKNIYLKGYSVCFCVRARGQYVYVSIFWPCSASVRAVALRDMLPEILCLKKAVVSVARYVIDKAEHTPLYNIKNIHIKPQK